MSVLEEGTTRLLEMGYDRQESKALLEAVSRSCLREVATIIALRRHSAPLFCGATGDSEQIDFELLSELFQSDDRSDFLPQLRAVKLLDACNEQQLPEFCRRINASLEVYKSVKPAIAALQEALPEFNLTASTVDAGRLPITACFVVAYPGEVLFRSFTFSDLNETLANRREVSVDFSGISWLEESREDLVFVSRKVRLPGSKKFQALEGSALSFEELSRLFPDRVSVAFDNFRSQDFSCNFNQVLADKHYRFDKRKLGSRTVPAPKCPAYTEYVAQVIAACDKLEVSEANRYLLKQMEDAAERAPYLNMSIPALSPERYRRWLVGQLAGACSNLEVSARAAELKLNWAILSTLTDCPDLQARVDLVTRTLPKQLNVGGERLSPHYHNLSGTALSPKIVLSLSALEQAEDQDLPVEWHGLTVVVECPRSNFLRQTLLTADGQFFNSLRVQHAACTEKTDRTDLPKAAYNLFKKVEVKHPSPVQPAREIIYLVAGGDLSYYTDYQSALSAAQEKLKELICDYINTVSKRKKLNIHPALRKLIAATANARARDDLSNLSELPDFISNFIAEKFEARRKLASAVVREFDQIIGQLKALGESRLVGRCMTLKANAEDALAVKAQPQAEALLQEARRALETAQKSRLRQ